MARSPLIHDLTNVSRLFVLMEEVQSRHMLLPGLGVFSGPSGFGKTTAVTLATNEFDAVVVQVLESDTSKSLCENILKEMGVRDPRGSVNVMVRKIGAALVRSGRPLIIDDAQYLIKRKMIGAVRDIHESGQPMIILVGEEELPHHLTKFENVNGRVRQWMQASACSLDDARKLAQVYADGVTVCEDLLQEFVNQSFGSTRNVSTNLERTRELGLQKGLDRVDLAAWGMREFYNGQPPRIRSFGGPDSLASVSARRVAG